MKMLRLSAFLTQSPTLSFGLVLVEVEIIYLTLSGLLEALIGVILFVE